MPLMSSRPFRILIAALVVFALAIGIREGLLALFPYEEGSAAPLGSHKRSTFDVALDAVGNKVEGSFALVDQDGAPFTIQEWFDKPLLVIYMFTTCKDVCPATAGQLARIVAANKERLGTDFRIVSVGFDLDLDTPAAMKKFGSNFTTDFTNWKFVSGPKGDIRRLATNLGIAYTKGQRGGWRHTVGFTILAPQGIVFSQQFGVSHRAVDVLGDIDRALGRVAEKKEPTGETTKE